MKNNQFLSNYLPENAIPININMMSTGTSGMIQNYDLIKSSV